MASRSGQRRRPAAGGKNRPRRPSTRQGRLGPTTSRPGLGRAGSSAPTDWGTRNPLALLSSTVAGVPAWGLAAGGVVWLVMVVLWVTGATNGGFAVFLATLLSAAMATGWLAMAVARGKEVLRGARAAVLVLLSAAVPVVFDPHGGDVFNLPKYTVVVIGALALAGLWVIAGVHYRAVPGWRNGLQWVVGALVAWALVSALVGVDVRVSLLGNYGSYDGLYSAAAFGVVFMAVAEALDPADVRRALSALAFGGGTVVVVYGLIQLPGTELNGPNWDFITWHLGSFSEQIFSTFGNPNHLGGYLAMILPALVVLGLGAKRWPWRAAAGLMALVVLTELVRTAARGAWVGAICALLTVAILSAPELRRRPLLTMGGAGGVLCVAIVGVAAFGRRFLGQPLSSLFQTGGVSSVAQRTEIWGAAGRIALDRPIAGTGPDTFALMYPRYQSSTWVTDFGPNYLVNGAHDIFMNVLADQGFIGLLLFLALLVFIGLRSTGAWRRLRSIERDENVGLDETERARSNRVCLAVVAAAIVAYVVQAVFNVQQIGLTFVFWILVGCLAALARAAGVPDTLRPALVVAMAGADKTSEVAAATTSREGRRAMEAPAFRSATRRPGRGGNFAHEWPTVVSAVGVVAVVVLLSVGTDMPYRADHDYWAANTSIEQNPDSTTPTPVGQQYFDDMQHALSLNPWEPTYPEYEATIYSDVAQHASNLSQAVNDLRRSRDLLKRSVADEPLWGPFPSREAQVDVELAQLQPSQAKPDLAAAASLAREAIKDSPRDAAYSTLLSKILATHPAAPTSHKATIKS